MGSLRAAAVVCCVLVAGVARAGEVAAPAAPPPAAFPEPTPEEAVKWLSSALGFKLRPLGFLAVNVIYNTGTTAPMMDAPIYATVAPKNGIADRPEPWANPGSFLITPRQSRIGAEVTFALPREATARAQAEMDFWGLHLPFGPPGITQGSLRLRSLFLAVGWKHLSLKAGQDLIPFAPGYPKSINHLAVVAFTGAGMLWNRAAQVTLQGSLPGSLVHKRLGDMKLGVDVGAVRPISGDHEGANVTFFETQDPGTTSMLPFLQARGYFASPIFTAGMSGHGGVENHIITTADGTPRTRRLLPTWAVAADARVAFKGFFVQGQGYLGSNLNGFFSGNGVKRLAYLDERRNPIPRTTREVQTQEGAGGWMQAGAPLWPGVLDVWCGAGTEFSLRNERVPVGGVQSNTVFQLGVLFPVHKHFEMGTEVYTILTRYKSTTGEDLAHNTNVAFTMRVMP